MHKYSLLTNTSINKKYKTEYMSSAAGKDCKIPLHVAMDELENHVSFSFPRFPFFHLHFNPQLQLRRAFACRHAPLLTQLCTDMRSEAHAVREQGIARDTLWAQIERIVALTLCAVHPRLSLSYRSCLTEYELQNHQTSKCFQVNPNLLVCVHVHVL